MSDLCERQRLLERASWPWKGLRGKVYFTLGILIISSQFWLRSGRLDLKSRVAHAHQIGKKEIGDSNLSTDMYWKTYMVILAGLNKFEKGVVRMKWLPGEFGVQTQADDSIDISEFR